MRKCAWCGELLQVKSLFSRDKYCDEHKKEARLERNRLRRRKYYQRNKESEKQRRREYYQKNRENVLKNQKEYYINNLDKIKATQSKYFKKILSKNPELTPQNRRNFGFIIRQKEYRTSKNGYESWETHHILPVWLLPNFALEQWNGLPISKEWHKQFHIKLGGFQKKDPSIDYIGLLTDFIESKIKESNQDLTTLEQFGVVK